MGASRSVKFTGSSWKSVGAFACWLDFLEHGYENFQPQVPACCHKTDRERAVSFDRTSPCALAHIPYRQFFERRTSVMTRADESPKMPRTNSNGRKPANRYTSRRRLRLRIVAIEKSCQFPQQCQSAETRIQQGFQTVL